MFSLHALGYVPSVAYRVFAVRILDVASTHPCALPLFLDASGTSQCTLFATSNALRSAVQIVPRRRLVRSRFYIHPVRMHSLSSDSCQNFIVTERFHIAPVLNTSTVFSLTPCSQLLISLLMIRYLTVCFKALWCIGLPSPTFGVGVPCFRVGRLDRGSKM